MTQTENTSRFNPNEHLIQLKSKAGSQDYLPTIIGSFGSAPFVLKVPLRPKKFKWTWTAK